MDVEFRHLRCFAAVAARRSFTQAANELAITQPQLSRTVRQLEQTLRVTLLDRDSRHVELTEAGRHFYHDTERILGDLERAIVDVKKNGGIRFGFSWLLPDPWAQRTFQRFESSSGGVVRLTRCDDVMAALRSHRVDVGLVRGHVISSTVRTVHLFDEARVAVCSARSRLADQDRLEWTRVGEWPLVVNTVSGTTGPWSWPDDQAPDIVIETANFDEWIETVATGRGIGIVPDVAMRRGIHPNVRFVALEGAPPSPVSLAFLPRVQEPMVRLFLDSALAGG